MFWRKLVAILLVLSIVMSIDSYLEAMQLREDDMSTSEIGKTVIITGSNSGLGFETAKKIAAQSKNFNIILACRNAERAEKAKELIISETKNPNVTFMQLDTASLKSVRKFVENYKKYNKPIYALLCNAGMSGNLNTVKQMTEDGFDVVFATNHLGHFLLTNLLLPFMDKNGKIIVTSSDMHNPPLKEGQKFEWIGTEAIAHPDEEMAIDFVRYSYSKLCNLYFVYELSKILKTQGSSVTVNAFNPGLMKTHFSPEKAEFFKYVRVNMPERYGDLDKSSTALAELVYSEDIIQTSGNFYDRSTKAIATSPLSYDEKNARELWEKSSEYTMMTK